MIFEFKPYSLEGNIGNAYNHYCSLVKDTDYIVLYDADTMVLTPGHGHMLSEVISKYGNIFKLFTCYTNRVNNKNQIIEELFDEPDIRVHRKKAIELYNKELNVKRISESPGVRGFMIMFSKDTWQQVSGFRDDGILGVDCDFSRRVSKIGNIGLIENMYVLHYYRLNEGRYYTEHLK